MGTKIKVGYQGVIFSNNYFAAKMFFKGQDKSEIELIPLVSSKNVINAIIEDSIDYGIVAVSNSIIGEVKESHNAIMNKPINELQKIDMLIKHSAFKLNSDITKSQIKYVVSHEAALSQCKQNINKLYPNAKFSAIENTALGPKYLIEGKIDTFSIVICSKSAGEYYGLALDEENISDRENNITTFAMFEKVNK